MGSKKLKAIVVGGNQEIPVFDRARLKECNKKIYQSCPRKKLPDVIDDYVEEIKLAFRTGGVPVKNWRGGAFDPAEKFGDSLRNARMGFCSRCPYSDTESMYNSNGERHIIWEHWGPVGTNCLIDNVEALYFIEDYLYVNPEDEQRLRDVLEEFGYSTRLDRFETQGKGELVAKMQNFGAMLNSMVVCSFMLEYQRVRPSEFIELLNSVTDWDMDYDEFMKAGERN